MSEDRFAEFRAKENEHSHIKKVIAVMSGKGGVGKSLTTALLAVNAARAGLKTAILDADVTGPSIPSLFGLKQECYAENDEIIPAETSLGIKAISLNLLNIDKNAPVVWRGPVIASFIKQLYSDVRYGDIDEMYVDMPPGTSDVPLTVFQSLPVKAVVVVTSPQDLVSLIVEKALKMALMMDVPLIGLVENMAYMDCPDCGKRLYPFGKSHNDLAKQYGIPHYFEMPIDPELGRLADTGSIEKSRTDLLLDISKAIHEL